MQSIYLDRREVVKIASSPSIKQLRIIPLSTTTTTKLTTKTKTHHLSH